MTYQDLARLGADEAGRIEFIVSAINEHKGSTAYARASDAEQYYAKHNVTIEKFKKVLYNLQGSAVTDIWSANYKLKTMFFRRFVLQQTQYVLSNGATFSEKKTKEKLGKKFDKKLQELAKKAMVDGVAFGFWNYDHLEVFSFVDTKIDPGFVPLYDEETSQLRAGIRYWYLKDGEDSKLRCVLYEEDGYRKYVKEAGKELVPLEDKRGYIKNTMSSEATGTEETYENYGSFPIVPMYANDLHTSELEGLRENIDCYDFIKSGFANDIDMNGIYWVLKNAGGMDDEDLARFVERMKLVKATSVDTDDGAAAEAHTIDIPVEARSTMLDRLRSDMYEDFMLLDTEKAITGNITATGIRLAYQPQDDKCGDFEYYIIDFVENILRIAGIDDTPTFKWNRIANQSEETQMVMTASTVLDKEAILKHLPWLTPEEVEAIISRAEEEDLNRFGNKSSSEDDDPGTDGGAGEDDDGEE